MNATVTAFVSEVEAVNRGRTAVVVALTVAVLVVVIAAAAPGRLERHGSLPWSSPDGKRIVFESSRDGSNLQIYDMNADGADVRRLTHSSATDIGPVWASDGKWIVFRSFHGDVGQLVAIRPDGSERHIVSDRKDIGWPRISPDGKRVAFQSSDEMGAPVIVTVNLDGSDLRTVQTGIDRPWDPVWSPDGKQLVFAEQPPDAGDPTAQTESVYISEISGYNRRLLATFAGFIQLPAWSPDGKTIAYQTWTGKRGDADIVLLNVASGKFTTITHRDHPYLDETPAWLPDGRLLFQSTRDGRYEIYVMNSDGSSPRRLTN
jgi:TolB protein